MNQDDFARKLDWNLLKVFHEIAEAHGVGAAAGRLSRRQPAISLALKRLEERIGASLCRRGAGGFELSDEGAVVAEICRDISRLVADMPYRIDNISTEARGRLRVEVISNLVLDRLDEAIATFHRRYPLVEIDLGVATWDSISRSLLKDGADVGIAPAEFLHAELSYHPLFREVYRPYCGSSHHLFGAQVESPAQLSGEAFVLTGGDEPIELTKYRLRYGLGRTVAGLSEHLEEAKRLAILGMGVCFLPEGYAAADVDAGRLWPLTTDSTELPSTEIFVITNPGAPRRLPRLLFLEELRVQDA